MLCTGTNTAKFAVRLAYCIGKVVCIVTLCKFKHSLIIFDLFTLFIYIVYVTYFGDMIDVL